jgi:hypothetical protein
MTGNALSICEFSFYGTARMKGVTVIVICRVIPSYHTQKIIKMSVLSLSGKEFLRSGIKA